MAVAIWAYIYCDSIPALMPGVGLNKPSEIDGEQVPKLLKNRLVGFQILIGRLILPHQYHAASKKL